ncbi:MAG: asparagine synthase (glutamine-hydrolyzing) [Acidimicrobiales bacterium]
MCGVVGVFRADGGSTASDQVLIAMRDEMTHRGPDGAGLWRSNDTTCALAHRRLSIIDLSEAAGQPMVSEDGQVVLVFNGEIYNHADLRRQLQATGRYRWKTDHSDTEVLLHAFEEWGPACAERLYGMFAFAVWDGRSPSGPILHLVRDRMGVKPLYLARTAGGEWLFASEIKGLLRHPHLTPEMDLTAFWHYLTFIVAPAPLTMFRGIFKIPAGYRVTIDASGAAASKWWDCRPSTEEMLNEADLSLDEAAGELTRLLRQSIARRMVSDVPFGVLLSGGVDSSLNVALMAELMDRPVTTFTIGYQGEEATNEFSHARRVAERYGTDHHERHITAEEALTFLPSLVRHQDEPIADNVCIPLYFLAGLVRDTRTTVVQVGEGADEHFLGYWWCEHYRRTYEGVYRPALAGRGPGWRRRWDRLARRGGPDLGSSSEDTEVVARAGRGEALFWGGATCFWGDIRRRLTPTTAPFAQEVDCPVRGLLPDDHRDLDSQRVVAGHLADLGELAEPAVLAQIPFLESRIRLPEHLLMRVDKMTMAHSVEARVPFLDHEVVEFARRLPYSYKLSDGVGKRVLKRAAEPFLDRDAIYRTKQGFGAPMDRWLADEEFGRKCLSAYQRSGIARAGLLDNQVVEDLFAAQTAGHGGHGFHLWTIMNAVLWHQSWVEGNGDLL